ncbi:MAG: FHA domain-containing protein [Myxococcota bacterium]
MAGRFAEWISEATRRRVFRTVGVYIVAVWGISSGGVDLLAMLGVPDWMQIYGLAAAIAATPIVAVLAWRFDIGREGIVRDPQDVLAEQQREAELAAMPTIVGGDDGSGALVIHWKSADGEHSALFTDEIFLGRGTDCRVRFYDPLVSRQHARIFQDGGVWQIEDLGSRNGTTLDGATVTKAPLGVDSEIRLNDDGPFLRVQLVAAGAETRAALASFPPGQPTAHVRLAESDSATTGGKTGRR